MPGGHDDVESIGPEAQEVEAEAPLQPLVVRGMSLSLLILILLRMRMMK